MAGVAAHDLINLARLIVGVFVSIKLFTILEEACDLLDTPPTEERQGQYGARAQNRGQRL